MKPFGIRASELVRPVRAVCFSVNMTHVALAISRRPPAGTYVTSFLITFMWKEEAPLLSPGRLIAAPFEVAFQPRNNHFFSFPPSRVYFCFSVGTVNFQTLNCALPSLLWRRSTCARMNRKWRLALHVSPRRLLSPTV